MGYNGPSVYYDHITFIQKNMTLAWISYLFNQKGLIVLSVTSALTAYLPAKLHSHMDDVFFVVIGWMVAMLLTFIEYKTETGTTKRSKLQAKREFFSKIIVYTMMFFLLKFFHLWVIFEDHEYLAATVNFFVISTYALISLGELKLTGENLKKRYGRKPKVFEYFDAVERWIINSIVKRAERVCDLDSEDKDSPKN